MIYKEDWELVKGMFKEWWENGDNILIQVITPRTGFEEQWYNWDTWLFMKNLDNFRKVVKHFIKWCEMTYFGGAAYPNLWINFGPGILAAFLGAPLKFTGDTVWFGASHDPSYSKSLDELLKGLEIDKSNIWWKRVREATKIASEMSRDKFIVGITDIGGVVDVLASLRGTLNLLKDMFIRPNDVEKVIWNIFEIWHWCYDELCKLITQEGTSAWMGLWCHERWYPIQCDFAYMLSPRLFRRFVLPHIIEHCKLLDHVIYHLDGPGELPHVDMLLSIKELDGIQWVPGASMELSGYHCGSPRWLPLYRKILKAGKRLVIAVPPNSIDFLLRELPHRGILFQTYCKTEYEAKKLLKKYGIL